MNYIRGLTGIFLLLVVGLPVMLAVLVIDNEADLVRILPPESDRTASIQDILIAYDPNLLIDTDDQVIDLTEAEVNALLAYFAEQIPIGDIPGLTDAVLEMVLGPARMELRGSLILRATPFGDIINFSLRARPEGNTLTVTGLTIGDIEVPAFIYHPMIEHAPALLADNQNFRLAQSLYDSVNNLVVEEDSMQLTLNWQTENLRTLSDQARQVWISTDAAERLVTYHEKLVAITRSFPSTTERISLNELLNPMFSLALADERDPREENRAVFLVLTSYLTDMDPSLLLGEELAATLERPRPLTVTLASRRDMAQHIVASAAIAAAAGVELANIVSVYKEVHDSRYRTGFSFSDLTANLVGTGMGRLGNADIDSARRLQAFLSTVASENDYMPSVEYYEGLSESEFMEEYGSRESEAYRHRLREIEVLASQRPLFQAFDVQLSFEDR